jgi:hypothetical protein
MYKKIKDFPNYSINEDGVVRNDKFNRELINTLNNQGYFEVQLWNNGKAKTKNIHRVLAEAFIPNPENKCCINHKDGNRRNNILDNLEWNTNEENVKHGRLRQPNKLSKKRILKIYKSKNWKSVEEFVEELIKF